MVIVLLMAVDVAGRLMEEVNIAWLSSGLGALLTFGTDAKLWIPVNWCGGATLLLLFVLFGMLVCRIVPFSVLGCCCDAFITDDA